MGTQLGLVALGVARGHGQTGQALGGFWGQQGCEGSEALQAGEGGQGVEGLRVLGSWARGMALGLRPDPDPEPDPVLLTSSWALCSSMLGETRGRTVMTAVWRSGRHPPPCPRPRTAAPRHRPRYTHHYCIFSTLDREAQSIRQHQNREEMIKY